MLSYFGQSVNVKLFIANFSESFLNQHMKCINFLILAQNAGKMHKNCYKPYSRTVLFYRWMLAPNTRFNSLLCNGQEKFI